MSEFFQPPPSPWPGQVPGGNAPPWTGRPQGRPPLGAAVSELLLARSEQATVHVAYLDAFPEGFEVSITASTSIECDDLDRDAVVRAVGNRFLKPLPDVFGRHWPMVSESRESIPPGLLRIGVQFADGRTATNIVGHDRPLKGPVLHCLRGGARGQVGRGESHFHQGYWISPLPPVGPVTIVCEWPAVGIPVVRREVNAQLILDAAERSCAMFPDGQKVVRDGHEWTLGTDGDVAWIREGTRRGRAITSAIPPVFEAYCTLLLPWGSTGDAERLAHEQAVIEVLTEQTNEQSWLLGFLDTGASDVVFPYAQRTELYSGWPYVLVQAGPQQATTWRDTRFLWALPELMFPADRSWLVSTLWDDDWTCVGGSEQLINRFLSHAMLGPKARRVELGQDATPPGHESR